MSDASQQATNPPSIHHDDEHEHGHLRTPFGIRATCLVLAIAAIALACMVYQRNALVADVRNQLNQSDSQVTQLKSDLDKAKAASSGLQSQLDGFKSQVADLNSQLDKARGQTTDVQSQLDKALSDRTALQQQVASDKTESADLRAQLTQANDKSAGLIKDLDQSKIREADLQAQLDKAQGAAASLQPKAVAARAMPIATAFKKSFWGGKYTMSVTNLDPGPLALNITVPGGAEVAPISVTIKSGATYEVKDLAPGANIAIAGDGYDSVNLTAH
jgi:septal ring factor EnvC (AmiA/AmiB activator)